MRQEKKAREKSGILRGVLMLAVAAVLLFSVDGLAIVSHAQSKGKVTATSVNIRKDPDRNSTPVGSALKDKEVTINSQVQGSDGKVWYQVAVDATTVGYIRSDFVEITDGTTPPAAEGTTLEPAAPAGAVEPVNPVSATVKGGDKVRIRSDASTTADNIVTTVSNGLVLTVTGRLTDGGGKIWYKVSFSDNGAEVEGFIREDYVTVSGEVTPYTAPEPEPSEEEQPEPEPEPEVSKDFDTELIDGEWYLLDYTQNTKQRIEDLFNQASTNAAAYAEEHKKVESGKIIIIILIFLLVAAASGIAMLVFKLKDMSDDVYFNQVEKETLRRRGDIRPKGDPRRATHTVGVDKPASLKPAGARSVGSQAGVSQGQKSAGGQTGASQGQRPAGGSQGARPAGGQAGAAQGQRPAGSQAGVSQSQRSAGSQAGVSQSQRPAGGQAGVSQGQRPAGSQAGAAQGQRHEPSRESGSGENRQKQGSAPRKPGQQNWQSRNFMSEEDDEFEFGFLNYEGDGK